MARRRAVPAHVKKIVRARDRNVCRMCGKKYPPSFFDYDHIDAYIAGGSDDPDNIRLLCKECNLKKGPKLHCDNCGTLNTRNAPRCISCGIRNPNRGRTESTFLFGLSKRRLLGLLLILWIVASLLDSVANTVFTLRRINSRRLTGLGAEQSLTFALSLARFRFTWLANLV
jgi:hypothetical protein